MENIFRKEYRTLETKEVERVERVKDLAYALYLEIENSGQGREQSIAKTKLEESVMWAVKGITQ